MSEPLRALPPPAAPDLRAALAVLAREAWVLEPPMPYERRGILRDEAALLVDGLLARVARGRGALDVALGEGLAAIAGRTIRIGYSGVGDYARERLGVHEATSRALVGLAEALRSRPILREAVRRGEVGVSKAQVVVPVAVGDAEPAWVERARRDTVRALEDAVAAAGAAHPARREEWERVAVMLAPEERAVLDTAIEVAGVVLGAAAPRWKRLEAICQEYLGAYPGPECVDEPLEAAGVIHAPVEPWLRGWKGALEEETARWAFLTPVEPVPAPVGPADPEPVGPADPEPADPHRLDARLRELASMRAGWDELVGHLAMLVRTHGLWRDMRFASFAHYCTERLGLSVRNVQQRIALERRLHELPALRAALRDGRVSYEQARVVAAHARDDGEARTLVATAADRSCVALRRGLDETADAQVSASAELTLAVPTPVAALVCAAVGAVRDREERWMKVGACLARVAWHFIETWRHVLEVRMTRHRKALARDHGLCQVPGCSRVAVHAHHVDYRSRGGGDELENLVGLCAAHHLHGVHGGFVRVEGRAPDRLRWELGVRPGAAPLAVYGALRERTTLGTP